MNLNDPAFPRGDFGGGLTKREYFAALAIHLIVRDGSLYDPHLSARAAVIAADALIAELSKESK